MAGGKKKSHLWKMVAGVKRFWQATCTDPTFLGGLCADSMGFMVLPVL